MLTGPAQAEGSLAETLAKLLRVTQCWLTTFIDGLGLQEDVLPQEQMGKTPCTAPVLRGQRGREAPSRN